MDRPVAAYAEVKAVDDLDDIDTRIRELADAKNVNIQDILTCIHLGLTAEDIRGMGVEQILHLRPRPRPSAMTKPARYHYPPIKG